MVQSPAVLCRFVYRRGRVLSEPSFLESSSLSSVSSSSSSFILILFLFFLILFLPVLGIETAYTAKQVLHHIPSPETCFLIIKSKQRVDACEVKAAYTWGKSLQGYRIERDGGWGRWLFRESLLGNLWGGGIRLETSVKKYGDMGWKSTELSRWRTYLVHTLCCGNKHGLSKDQRTTRWLNRMRHRQTVSVQTEQGIQGMLWHPFKQKLPELRE